MSDDHVQLLSPKSPLHSDPVHLSPSTVVYGAIPTDSHPLQSKPPPTHLTNATAYISCTRQNSQSSTIASSNTFFAISRSSSTLTVRSALCLPPPPPPGHIDFISIYVVYLLTLVSEASRGLTLPSTWPYFQHMGGSKDKLGVFVASFSFGRMISTIPLGYLSDHFSSATVLIIASFVQVLGHLLYSCAPNLHFLYISRVIVGLGSATMSVSRAHVTRTVPSAIRTPHFAYLSGLQFIGFAVLPGLGGLLAMLPEVNVIPFLPLNGYTYPALLLLLANLVCMVIVYGIYIDPPPSVPSSSPMMSSVTSHGLESTSPTTNSTNNSATIPNSPDVTPVAQTITPDLVAMSICLLVNVVFRGVIAEFETVSVPFLMEQYGLSFSKSSFFLSGIGFIGLLIYLCFKPIAQIFSDRGMVLFGLIVIALGCIPLSLRMIVDRMPTWVYVFFLGLTWSIAYPVGQTAVLSLFSKVLARLPAGSLLGIFSMTGSIARLCLAIVAGLLWNWFGREAVYSVIVVYVMVVLAIATYWYGHLKPCASS